MGAQSSKGAVIIASSHSSHSWLAHNKKALHVAAREKPAQELEQLLQPLVSAITAEMAIPGAYPGPAAAALGQAVGYSDRLRRTALLEACLHGSWECADLLLEAGSNIMAVDIDGNSCLHLACINGHGHVVEQVRSRYPASTIFDRLARAEIWHDCHRVTSAVWSCSG